MASMNKTPPVPTKAWEMARDQFIKDLPEEERIIFKDATLENLFESSSSAHKKYVTESKLQAFSKKIQPLVENIDAFGQAMDVFANASSLVLCPLWGSIRVVLHISREYSEYFEKLIEMFARIGDVLPRFRAYEALFPNHSGLCQALCKAYLQILTFCANAKSMFLRVRRSSISWATCKILWKPFAKSFDDCISVYRTYQKNVEKEAGLCHLIESKQGRENQQAIQVVEKQRNLLNLLSTLDYKRQHRKIQKLRHHGTGSWLIEVPTFRSWSEDETSGCFCCFGIPGSGKTILASTIVDSMSPFFMEVNTAICYYYCDYAETRTLDPCLIFGTLIRQLLERITIPSGLVRDIDGYFEDGSTQPLPEDYIQLLTGILSRFTKIMIILDGVDELAKEDQTVLIHAVRQITDITKPVVKIMIFSRREEKLIRKAFERYDFVDISTEFVGKDIARFIEDSVDSKIQSNELQIGDSSLRKLVIDTLVEGAKDMFLWVKFQLDELCEAITEEEMRETLKNLPKDLAATYARIIQKLCTCRGGATNSKVMQKIFPWIICAKRPLTVEELNEAYAISPSDNFLDRTKIPTDPRKILEACGSLILFDKDDSTVRFAHHTVKQFVVGSTDTYPLVDVVKFTLEQADFIVGEMCVTYLSFSDFETQLVQRKLATVLVKPEEAQRVIWNQIPGGSSVSRLINLKSKTRGPENRGKPTPLSLTLPKPDHLPTDLEINYCLLRYVTENWHWHTSQFTPTIGPAVWAKFMALTFERQFAFEIRPWANSNIKPSKSNSLPYLDLFRWALDHDLVAFLLLLEDQGIHNNTQSLQENIKYEEAAGRNPWSHAYEKGCVAILRYLLGQDLEQTKSYPMVHHGAMNGYNDIVQLLVETEWDVDLKYSGGRTLLSWASERGHEAVVRLLLASKAAVDSKDNYSRTPLSWAAKGGHEAVVRLLLASKADVGSKDNDGRTPLLLAAKGGYEAVVSLLLVSKADVGLKDNNGRTPLLWAAKGGYEAVVRLLLASKADVESKDDGYGQTPLSWAAERGHEAVVRLLLASKADVESKDRYGQTPLSWAAEGGHEAVVRLLLASKADVESKDIRSGQTPLSWAAKKGHEAVVRLLLASKADVESKDRYGQTPLSLAAAEGHEGVVELLQSYAN